MGNHISSFPASDATGKIVYCDGSVQEFDQPLTVAELMLEHPQQVVVEFHSALNHQKRPTPLPADKKLEMKKTYVMLPMKRGKPVGLSGEDCHRVLSIVNSSLHSNYLMCSGFLPWIARVFKTESPANGVAETLQIKEERYDFSEFLPEMIEERPEYMSRQLSGKEWKPSLDTIKEKKIKKKLSRWFFLKSFIGTRI
ncbi:uncharacterized protein LOC130732724 [Lotus japonicus]|uniref:Multidrug resistance protein ABC transporter family protein n=1 Tax=Lotus japonicus TaxID=34305 RepID=I3SI31_LOTJA|nr:uncharacterized protein LOC130732724 [Lotus japonicus]AFK39923.1 unknown [Lotus japonicus]